MNIIYMMEQEKRDSETSIYFDDIYNLMADVNKTSDSDSNHHTYNHTIPNYLYTLFCWCCK